MSDDDIYRTYRDLPFCHWSVVDQIVEDFCKERMHLPQLGHHDLQELAARCWAGGAKRALSNKEALDQWLESERQGE